MDTVWIVVADAARARILSCEGRACHGLKDVEAFSHSESRAQNQDLVSDRQGRGWASASGDARHAMDEPTDPAQHERERFARAVAERLKTAHHQGVFKHLAIIASPSFLGVLREGTLLFDVRALAEDEIPYLAEAVAAATGGPKP